MNPRQRRGVVLVVLAALGMLGVFLAISAYVSDVRTQVGPDVTILRFAEDIGIDDPVTEEMTEEVEVPERYVPDDAITDYNQILQHVATSDFPSGTYIQTGMTEADPAGGNQEREISILVDAETGVAGRIRPGDTVDILATFPGEDSSQQSARFQIEKAEIVAVGLPAEVQEEGAGGTLDSMAVVPVTFALSPKESLEVTYAESFAEDVRLVLLSNDRAEGIPNGSENFRLGQDGPEFFGDPK